MDDNRSHARIVASTGEGHAQAITERFLIEGSTVEQVREHAGIVKVECYEAIFPL